MNRHAGLSRVVIVLFMVVLINGCTKEKGEAIKVAAEQFQVQAITALDKIENLFEQSVSMPVASSEEEIERIANDLDKTIRIGPEELNFLLTEANIGQKALNTIDREFEGLKGRYYLFADMFRSLPAGSFFARGAVKRSEKHAINLTLEFIRFADILKNRYPVQFTARRVLILERVKEDKGIGDENLRKRNLKLTAQAILELRNDEAKAKEEAISQCLKAAETGKLVSELIRNYKSLSVGELLASTRNTLSFVNEISGGDIGIDSLMKRYESIETTLREDPYWKELLDVKIKPIN